MSNVPPPQFANYPRQGGGLDPQKLRLLADGYFGLNNVFIVNIILVLATNAGLRSMKGDGALGVFMVLALVIFFVIAGLTYPQNKKIGDGLGWNSSGPVIASVLMGLNSALCCGIIGYVVMQSFASKKFKEAGMPGGSFFGYKKPHVYSYIASLENNLPPAP